MGDEQRRNFFRHCGALVGMFSISRGATAAGALVRYPPTMLVDRRDRPLTPSALDPRTEYIFAYPYVTTPCFLIDLDRECPGGEELVTSDGSRYHWRGGIGPRRSLVAFSAICAHRLSHPTKSASFIGYRPAEVGYLDHELSVSRRADVIQCCSEQSVYDPAHGARVLGGPAPQPLAAIEMEVGNDGYLYATGVHGGALFPLYFERFSHRLVLEYETFEVEAPVSDTTTVMRGDEFSRHLVQCG